MFYAIAWLAVGALAAGVVIGLLRSADDEVTLPPVEQTELTRAADSAGCVLRRGPQRAGVKPPVEGPAEAPLAARAYDRAQSEARLVGSLRRGLVVIAYRPGIDDEELAQLRELREGVPRATILVPYRSMRQPLVATAWRRVLACPRMSRATIDAIRLFRGRYVGQGPEGAG
jgi:hypothetical protein